MKRVVKSLLSVTLLLIGVVGVFWMVGWWISSSMPVYKDSAGNVNYTEKMTGLYLLEESAARDDNLIIYGSSELRTTEISTHPSNFFEGKRNGFQINLVGRGSCQSLIHAISVGATEDTLVGKKIVLITSPQSYVPDGIAPDMFMANFSPQQYLRLLEDENISDEVKQYISMRVEVLFRRYEEMPESVGTDAAVRYLAEYTAAPTAYGAVRNAVLSPYYAFSRYCLELKDKVKSKELLNSLEDLPIKESTDKIDWDNESRLAEELGKEMSSNNDFGMLSDYYTTYIGSRLSRQKNSEASLDYSVSEEYDDLRVLLELCRQKGIEPLFVHVPLHGQWSDYTGFTKERRQEYYDNVREIVLEYDVEMLDLTEYEYEEYFLCDVMHLGWKGWLEVDKALIEYYYSD